MSFNYEVRSMEYVADDQWRFFNSLFLRARVDRNPIYFPGLAAVR
jgi:hypothetical protein